MLGLASFYFLLEQGVILLRVDYLDKIRILW